ncbi:MAG: hypothetical protein HN368_07720 [Spirochaetales bacterium]|jgi:hypothetical protein|nr:hypothetical protein [Spirochaetales bacterium]
MPRDDSYVPYLEMAVSGWPPKGKVAVVFVNLEEFVEKQVIPTAERNHWQEVFMYNSNLSDTPCFEPEYGLSKLLAEYYATTPDQHYLIHTKSANIDFLRDLDHRGHTILLWSITSDTVSRIIEPGSATTEERIEAVRMCQDAGYTVRVKFKPIVPVDNWRAECSHMIENLFAHTRPDNVGLCSLAWMDAEELYTLIDGALLDPNYLQAIDESAGSMKGDRAGPFPHHVRAEIYEFFFNEIRKYDADVPVCLCTESAEMWREFAPRLGVGPGNYVCGCGPQSTPGAKRLQKLMQPAELI